MRKNEVRQRGDDAKDAIKTEKTALITKARNTIGILLDSPSGSGTGGSTGKKCAFKKLDKFLSKYHFI